MERTKIINKILDLIYPPVCSICGKLNPEWLCNRCKVEVKKLYKLNIEKEETNVYDEHIHLFSYSGIIREELLKYKFKENSYKYKMFVNLILNEKNTCDKIKEYDIILPVPISKKRYKERGYNQCELIAKNIAKNLQIEYSKNILKKVKNTVAQSTLSKEEREKNIIGAYTTINEEKLKNKKVLLIDDIFTTGNTARECAKIIRKANPKQIGVLTIAKD